MRRILIGILLCMLALGAQAITYGELEWAVEARVNASKRNKPDASTLLPHILQGLPVRVNIELPQGNGTAPVQCSNVKKDVTKSYNDWFKMR